MSTLLKIEEKAEVEARSLQFCEERLKSLLTTLQVTRMDDYRPISAVAEFLTSLATYSHGFTVILDPYPEAVGVFEPTLELSCLDASIAMAPVLKRFGTVVLTSGTMSPLDIYPKLLSLKVVRSRSLSITFGRECVRPLVIARGADQVPLSSRFSRRQDAGVTRNYGRLLEDICAVVPDGVVCFFPSKMYMRQTMAEWYDSGVLARVQVNLYFHIQLGECKGHASFVFTVFPRFP